MFRLYEYDRDFQQERFFVLAKLCNDIYICIRDVVPCVTASACVDLVLFFFLKPHLVESFYDGVILVSCNLQFCIVATITSVFK